MAIRLNDEHWQSNLQGTQYTTRLDRLIHERAQQETTRYRLAKAKQLGKRYVGAASMHETVAVAILNSKGRIESVGINKPDDLILDNFGKWIAGMFRPGIPLSITTVSLKDDSNTSRDIYTYTNTAYFNYGSSGTVIKVGSGTTTPERDDYTIETPFGTAPESGYIDTNTGSYANTHATFSASTTAGGNGTVNETGVYGYWRDSGSTTRYFMLFHDLLDTGQSFTAGQIINISYSIDI